MNICLFEQIFSVLFKNLKYNKYWYKLHLKYKKNKLEKNKKKIIYLKIFFWYNTKKKGSTPTMNSLWNFDYIEVNEKIKDKIILFYLVLLLLIGLILDTPSALYTGMKNIFLSTGTLLTDYMIVGGVGAALINGSFIGILGYIILKINKVSFSGPAIASVFTMTGFGFFGKNLWSVVPIILGTYLYSKVKKQKFKSHIFPALFGTALVPLVTQVAFEFQWGFLASISIGIISGFIISPISSHLLIVNEGYNLYNTGFAAGFIGLLFVSIFRNFGFDSSSVMIWGTENSQLLRKIFISIFISMVICGTILTKGKFKNYIELVKHPGTLISDFPYSAGFGSTILNMGLVGLIGAIYIDLVNGHYNGPTVGALLTMSGFAAFGKHPLNITPVMFGAYLATLTDFTVYSANNPTALLAALFGTTLAPLSGAYGPLVGILAGFTHLCIVSNVGVLHGWLNLYNNGFSGGIVATIFIALIQGLKTDK